MRIVLIGATGFLGHHVLPLLSAEGHDCLALTRYRPACRDLAVDPRVSVTQIKAWDASSLAKAFEGADAIVSMAGILNEKGRKGKGFHKVHVELVEQMIEACAQAGVRRVVHVSALGAGEGDSYYQKSKGEAEALLREAGDIDETIIRPSVIFGPGDDFFNRFASLLRMTPVLPLACPEARLQPVFVGDVAAVIATALDKPWTVGKTMNAVGPHEYSLRELVEFTATAAGLKRRVIGLPNWLSRLQAAVLDFVPGKPFSTDNYRSLQTPNTSKQNCLVRFQIEPRSVESTVPGYLRQGHRQERLDDCRRWVNR